MYISFQQLKFKHITCTISLCGMATDPATHGQPEDPTYEWLKTSKLEFIYEHVKGFTIGDFANLKDKELEELIQENDGLNKLKVNDKLRFKTSVRQLRQKTRGQNDKKSIYQTQVPIEKMGLHKMTQDDQHRKAVHIQNECHYKLKLVVIGASGVGKSSIINQFINDRFEKDTTTTVGFDLSTTIIWLSNDERAFLTIFDTAGTEKYDSENGRFFKDADCIVVVYDITDEKSYNLIETRLIPMIDENCVKENVYIMIVGNKQDLRRRKSIDKKKDEKTDEKYDEKYDEYQFIPIEKPTALIDKYNGMKNGGSGDGNIRYSWGFSEVSAQSNSQIRQIFETCAEYSVGLQKEGNEKKNNTQGGVILSVRSNTPTGDKKSGSCCGNKNH